LIGIGALLGGVVLVTGLAIAALFLVDWNAFKGTIAGKAGASTGRKVEIRGDLNVHVAWRPEVHASDFVIANADWGSAPEMLHAKDVYFQFRIWPLLVGRLEVDSMRLDGLTVLLEKQKDRANWNFRASNPEGNVVKAAAPSDRESFPVLRELTIENAKLTYRAPGLKEPIEATFSSLKAHGGDIDSPVDLAMRGTYQGKKFDISANLGSYGTLRSGSNPYPVKIKIAAGETKAAFDGAITKPLDFQGIDGAMTLSGQNLDELDTLLGLALPQSPAYNIKGHLTQHDKTWSLKGFSGTLGSSDMHGDVAVETSGERPHLTATVRSDAVDISDIEGFWAAKEEKPGSSKGEKAASAPTPPRADEGTKVQAEHGGSSIPDTPIRLDKLRAMDVDLDFEGKSIKSSGPALDHIKVKLTLKDGKATMHPIELGILQGRVAGDLVLDGSRKVPSMQGDLRMQKLQLKSLLSSLDIDDRSVGTFRGAAKFKTDGGSLHQLASNMNGTGNLVMEGGRITNIVLELMALDLQEAIGQWIGGSPPVTIGCFLAPFTVKDGRMIADPWIFDTTDTLAIIRGYIDFKTEHTKMTLHPEPKDFSFFNLRTSITVEGDLATRKASVDKLDAAAKVVLKILAAPFMPLISPEQEDEARAASPCAEMIAKVQKQDGGNSKPAPARR
jgi:uncharacterized protein involved in outer membrane biogenesis